MTAVVFRDKYQEVFDTTPDFNSVKKHSILCLVGKEYQKWYYWTEKGWIRLYARSVRKDYRGRLKLIGLVTGIHIPKNDAQIDPHFWEK